MNGSTYHAKYDSYPKTSYEASASIQTNFQHHSPCPTPLPSPSPPTPISHRTSIPQPRLKPRIRALELERTLARLLLPEALPGAHPVQPDQPLDDVAAALEVGGDDLVGRLDDLRQQRVQLVLGPDLDAQRVEEGDEVLRRVGDGGGGGRGRGGVGGCGGGGVLGGVGRGGRGGGVAGVDEGGGEPDAEALRGAGAVHLGRGGVSWWAWEIATDRNVCFFSVAVLCFFFFCFFSYANTAASCMWTRTPKDSTHIVLLLEALEVPKLPPHALVAQRAAVLLDEPAADIGVLSLGDGVARVRALEVVEHDDDAVDLREGVEELALRGAVPGELDFLQRGRVSGEVGRW